MYQLSEARVETIVNIISRKKPPAKAPDVVKSDALGAEVLHEHYVNTRRKNA